MTLYTQEPPADATDELREMLCALVEEVAKGFVNLIESDIASGKITLAWNYLVGKFPVQTSPNREMFFINSLSRCFDDIC